MKFIEFFETAEATRRALRCVVVTGDDPVMKGMVARDFLVGVGSTIEPESMVIGDLRKVGQLLGEGSFYGTRFFDLTISSKVKETVAWKTLPDQIRHSSYYLLIQFDSDHGLPTGFAPKAGDPIAVVDCRLPKTGKDRAKILAARSLSQGILLDEEMSREILSRVKNSGDIESVLRSLKLLFRVRGKLTLKDVSRSLGAGEVGTVNSRALLTGNMTALRKDIDTLDPMLLLTSWIGILQRFYCWLCQESESKETTTVIDEDDDDDFSEVKINRYQMRDYAVAKTRYSLPRVREVMEDLNRIYQDLRRGGTCGWKERTKIVIQKLATKV